MAAIEHRRPFGLPSYSSSLIIFAHVQLHRSSVSTTAAASPAAKTDEDKTVVGRMDVSLGVSGVVRCHTKEDSRMRWAIVHRSALCVGLLAFLLALTTVGYGTNGFFEPDHQFDDE